MRDRTPINENIRSSELRVVGDDGENFGVISKDVAIAKAKELGLDLIEISPNAKPPVAKIMDYGKFQYDSKKKQREIKAKAHVTETKNVQIKMGTGEHDQMLKRKRIDEWLEEGHRVKVDLFLRGRYKYMEFSFLKKRLETFLATVTIPYKIADQIKKSPKGLSCILERDAKAQASAKPAKPEVKLPNPEVNMASGLKEPGEKVKVLQNEEQATNETNNENK